jgi:hypothetical protein
MGHSSTRAALPVVQTGRTVTGLFVSVAPGVAPKSSDQRFAGLAASAEVKLRLGGWPCGAAPTLQRHRVRAGAGG